MEGRPALPAALAGRRRPGLCGPSVPHGLAAAAGRRAGRRRARRRRQLLRLGRAMRLARACCRAMRRGPAGFRGPQSWGTGVDVAHHQEAHVRPRLVGRRLVGSLAQCSACARAAAAFPPTAVARRLRSHSGGAGAQAWSPGAW